MEWSGKGIKSIRFPVLFSLLLFLIYPLFPQTGNPGFSNTPSASVLSLNTEKARLEKLSSGAGGTARERYDAYSALARLYQLSGNQEAALKALDGALTLFPGDSKVLLEKSRLLISIGENEKAGALIADLLKNSQDLESLIQGRYLVAMLELLQAGNTKSFVSLTEDPGFSGYYSAIYYTLWKYTGLSSWKARLTAEFPQSPETKVANGTVNAPSRPFWFLFPGRNSITLSPPSQPAAPAAAPPSPAAAYPAAPGKPGTADAKNPSPVQGGGNLLQTGLFSKQENAQALAERLKKAGFEPLILSTQLNAGNFWSVCVPYGTDMNTMIMKLKNAGFESFPLKP